MASCGAEAKLARFGLEFDPEPQDETTKDKDYGDCAAAELAKIL